MRMAREGAARAHSMCSGKVDPSHREIKMKINIACLVVIQSSRAERLVGQSI